MKYLIIEDTNKYKYHSALGNLLVKSLNIAKDGDFHEGIIIDLAKDARLVHEIFFTIRDYKPDIILNLDLTGYIFKTENDNISLNSVPCRIVNILLHKSEYYGNNMRFRQNLSMFTYFSNNECLEKGIEDISNKYYEEIPNPKIMCEYDYNASAEDVMRANENNILKWTAEMIQEVHL